MGKEVNLLDRYPSSSRPVEERGAVVTEEQRAVARRFGREYFDGDRLTGYGGYRYHPRFWQDTVRRFQEYYQLADDASILDVGCGKGFMVHDFLELMPRADIRGVDISDYALQHAKKEVAHLLSKADAAALPFPDDSFDLVISINTIHNLPLEQCKQALREIDRVSRRHAFVVVDAWRDENQRRALMKWNLTALTYMSTEQWEQVFGEVGYDGDYWWFMVDEA